MKQAISLTVEKFLQIFFDNDQITVLIITTVQKKKKDKQQTEQSWSVPQPTTCPPLMFAS